MAAKSLPAMFGDFKHVARDDREEHFSELEWRCVTYLWVATGQRGGTVQYLFQTEAGEIDGEALTMLAEILAAVHAHVLTTPLRFELSLSASGTVILEVAKKAGLAYVRAYDVGPVLFRGTERVGPYDPATSPRVPRLGDLPPFRSAVAKLTSLLEGHGTLRFAPVAG